MPALSRPVLAAFAVVVAAVSHSPAPSRAAGEVVVARVRIDSTTRVAAIPDDFLGFGYETSAVAQRDFFTARNGRMVALYRNLGVRGLIRIGGNVSDHTRFDPDGEPAARTEREVTVINRANLNDLGDFARATGWRVMWGLNLGSGTREQAVEEAVAVDRALGDSLHSFEVGNEVDLMRKYAKDYDAYHAAFADWRAAIRGKLPHAGFSGPDSASSLPFVERFVADESADARLVTHHYYRTGARSPDATTEHLLARDQAFDARLVRLRELCAPRHPGYRINEVNSFYGGGKEGVSDTFGSALWCLDYLFDLAAHGCAGANLQTDVNQLGFISFYSPIVHDAAGVCSARPEYYGMLAFATAGRGELLKAEVVGAGDVNLTAWATRDGAGRYCLTAVNKDLARDATVECPLPEGCNAAGAYRLSAPSVEARAGVTFAGKSVADDGSWSPGAAEVAPAVAGVVRVAVPHASAVVLKFSHE